MKNTVVGAILLCLSLSNYSCKKSDSGQSLSENQTTESLEFDSLRFEQVKEEYFKLLELKIKKDKSILSNRDVQTAGQKITLEQARTQTCNWENRIQQGYDGNLDPIRAVMFNSDSIKSFIDSNRAAALRMYFVLRDDNTTGGYMRDVLLVPVDTGNNDMVKIFTQNGGARPTQAELAAYSVLNGSKPCPDRCPIKDGTACK